MVRFRLSGVVRWVTEYIHNIFLIINENKVNFVQSSVRIGIGEGCFAHREGRAGGCSFLGWLWGSCLIKQFSNTPVWKKGDLIGGWRILVGQVGDLYTVEPKKRYETAKSSQPDYCWENCLIGQEPHSQPKKEQPPALPSRWAKQPLGIDPVLKVAVLS